MTPLDPRLAAALETGATTLCHCWRVTRADGVALGFTDHDVALNFDGTTFSPESGMEGSRAEATADLAVDNMEIVGALDDGRLSADDLAAGRYDGARVEVWRVDWKNPEIRARIRTGTLGETTREGRRFRAELRGPAHRLSRPVGRVYARHCDAVLGDARCGVDLSAPGLSASGVVALALGAGRFLATGLGGVAAGRLALGALRWTAGANAGAAARVAAHGVGPAGVSLDLWTPPAFTIAEGDRFEVSAGCDGRAETCRETFGNLVNFRGFSLMPGNDFAIGYPKPGERHDGGRR